jgi:hypothetical protein
MRKLMPWLKRVPLSLFLPLQTSTPDSHPHLFQCFMLKTLQENWAKNLVPVIYICKNPPITDKQKSSFLRWILLTAKSSHLLRQNKDNFGRAIRWLTGHCFLNRHNHLLHPLEHPSPTCRACGQGQENPSHIICDCEAISFIRYFHFQEFLLPLTPIPITRQLTSFLNDHRIINLETLPHE